MSSRPVHDLTLAQARRTALAAQGLHRARPARPATAGPRRVHAEIERLGLLQIDSVNVLARAHLVPLFSRLGPYDTAVLERAAGRAPRRLVEAWAHEASFVVPEVYRLLGWRRRAHERLAWASVRSVPARHGAVVAEVLALLTEGGAATAREVHAVVGHDHGPRSEDWGWNWTVAKQVLEYLFFTGQVASAGRNAAFERRYDLAERVLPPAARSGPEPTDADAVRGLVALGARAHGIGTARCFADYVRVRGPLVRQAVADLVEAGELLPVRVRGWERPVLLHRDAPMPRRAPARCALLSPFDPVVFERRRLEELFGMRYRIEIYTPAPRRVHGYYVLPFLQGDRFTARVDLRADRRGGVLEVRSAFGEPEADTSTVPALAGELALLGGWLGLGRTEVVEGARGDLAGVLGLALAGSAGGGPDGPDRP